MKLVVSALAAALLSGGAAFAGGTRAPTFSWDGGYGGVQAGYAWGKSHYSEPAGKQIGTIDYDPRGLMGGIYGGYNWQFGNNVVLGGEADFAGGDVTGSGAYINVLNGQPLAGMSGHADLQWSGAVRGRLGYAIDRFLPYVAGGVAFGNYEYGADHYYNNGATHDFFALSSTRIGWTVGAGVEYALSNKLTGRFEYRHTDFGSKMLDWTETGTWLTANTVDLKTSEIRIGIAYKL